MGQRDGSLGLETFQYVHNDAKGNPFSIVRMSNSEWVIFKGSNGDAGEDTGYDGKSLTACRRIIDRW